MISDVGRHGELVVICQPADRRAGGVRAGSDVLAIQQDAGSSRRCRTEADEAAPCLPWANGAEDIG